MAHSAMHVWTGKSKGDPGSCTMGHDGGEKCSNDMGFLGSAGRDPVFYSHHSNVDRMWHLWSTKLGGKGFDDAEWLDTSFVFYDNPADPRLVRIRIRDVLDTRNLGYTYDAESEAALPWINSKPTQLAPRGGGASPAAPRAASLVFPLALTPDQAVVVPAVPRPAKEGNKLQVLVIEGIEFNPSTSTKLDVAINLPKELAPKVGPQHSEYAGSFVSVASSKEKGAGTGTLEGKITLVIDDVLADIGASGETVDVVIVPRTGDIKINLPLRIQNEDFC
uniref:Tyrosinase copper-binding domain-containing protein n=1 Tax=Arundo donax TaxID=35708 RepID=A0A0A9B4Z2_ARUDO